MNQETIQKLKECNVTVNSEIDNTAILIEALGDNFQSISKTYNKKEYQVTVVVNKYNRITHFIKTGASVQEALANAILSLKK